MKIIIESNTESEHAIEAVMSWPECVENSYEQLVAAVTAFANGGNGSFATGN